MRNGDQMGIKAVEMKLCTSLDNQHTAITSVGLPLDELAESLLPNDSPVVVPFFRAVRTSGNGSCLFNAVSLALTGKNTICHIDGLSFHVFRLHNVVNRLIISY